VRDVSKARLRVLSLVRLFSGLKPGLAAGTWAPAGVPAIYKLLEGLGADPEIDPLTVFTVKEPDLRFPSSRRQTLPRIGETVILPYRTWLGRDHSRANTALTEFEGAARILAIATRFRPDIVYATYANILPAALLARLGHRGVVLRMMGVVPHHRHIASGALPLFRWQLKSSFAHVVCSEDGSDPAAVLPKLMNAETPWTVRLNGCDTVAPSEQQVRAIREQYGLGARPVIAFLGRLESYKGSMDFVYAALALLAAIPDAADILIVGDGPLRGEMQARVAAAGQSARVHFAGARPHAEIAGHIAAADIYVSTNMYGNLSNANLEALATGACMVMPTSDAALPLDTATDRLIPADVALRYHRTRMPASLTEALCKLVSAPDEITRRRVAAAALAKRMVKPWAQSVADDIALLKALSSRRQVADVAHSQA
jgi:glycosyltransferase involved in cell wall biosynthesis